MRKVSRENRETFTIGVAVKESEYDMFKRYCDEHDRSMSQMLKYVLREMLRRLDSVEEERHGMLTPLELLRIDVERERAIKYGKLL